MDTALLVVDMQVGFFESNPPVDRAGDMLRNVKSLINRARRAQIPIIYIQHDSDPDYDGPIHPSIAPSERDTVILKYTPDSFHETTLQQELNWRGIRRLVIVGLQSEFCISATCRRAHVLGYEVILVEDAHSTFDNPPLTAQKIIAQQNETLREIVTLQTAKAVNFRKLVKMIPLPTT